MNRMLISKVLVLVVTLISLTPLVGGNSSGGGGELLRDMNNPWFLENVKEVKYCVSIDSKNFGLSEQRASELIADAFQYWKKEFAAAAYPSFEFGEWHLATQTFTKVTCNDSVDLRFQLGVLSEADKKLVTEPNDYVAVSVRTSYDETNLKGKGFVYVSPGAGALHFSEQGLVSEPWKIADGKLLYYVFLHELGHIFGIAHTGDVWGLMSAGFPEAILAKEVAANVQNFGDFHFFKLNTNAHTSCEVKSSARRLFGLSSKLTCLRIETQESGFQVYGSESNNSGSHWQLIGSAIFGKENVLTDFGAPIKLRLNPKQSVFSPIRLGRLWLMGPMIRKETRVGTYRRLGGGNATEVLLNYSPEKIVTASGLIDGKMVLGVFP